MRRSIRLPQLLRGCRRPNKKSKSTIVVREIQLRLAEEASLDRFPDCRQSGNRTSARKIVHVL